MNRMASNSRPKRSIPRPDYRRMANPIVPKCRKLRNKSSESSQHGSQFFRLQVVDEDASNELVKVQYIGYDSKFDEWQTKSDIIDLSKDLSDLTMPEGNELTDYHEGMVFSGTTPGSLSTISKPFSLNEELSYRIQCLLFSTRKGDPICCLSMTFDTTHFDGLIRHGTLMKGQQSVYTLSALTKLDDILGKRWYIRGINAAGDFCYVKPATVRYQLKLVKG